MSGTSDERREVAARLRSAAKTESGSPDYLWNRLEIAVNGWRFGDVIDESYVFYNSVLARLADLIDPTCKVMEVPDNDELKIRVVSGFMCKRCGHEDIVERNCDGSAEPPRFCPHCGARVVSHDDNQ